MLVKEGDDLKLTCHLTDGNPLNVSNVKWIKSETGQETGQVTVINETASNELVWTSIDRQVSGNYSCLAANEAGYSNVSQVVEIDVMYLPGMATILQVNGDLQLKGSEVAMDCVVTELGKPPADQFMWQLDGQLIEGVRGSRFHIEVLGLAQKGNYSCAAVSAAGPGPEGK